MPGAIGSPPVPKLFQLAVNYRSHSGIVNCAHAVIDLMTRFWPDSIDKLAPERGVAQGQKPVFFKGWREGSVHFEQFLFGDAGNHIEFGAQQCELRLRLMIIHSQIGWSRHHCSR